MKIRHRIVIRDYEDRLVEIWEGNLFTPKLNFPVLVKNMLVNRLMAAYHITITPIDEEGRPLTARSN